MSGDVVQFVHGRFWRSHPYGKSNEGWDRMSVHGNGVPEKDTERVPDVAVLFPDLPSMVYVGVEIYSGNAMNRYGGI